MTACYFDDIKGLSLASNSTQLFFQPERTISPSNLWLSPPVPEPCSESPSPMFSIQSVLCLYSDCISYWQPVSTLNGIALIDHLGNNRGNGRPNVYKGALDPL